MPDTTQIPWHELHVKPRCEKKLAAHVGALPGLALFLPLREETKIYQRRKVTVRKPLFPGYLFARFTDSNANRIEVDKTIGVSRILGYGKTIEPVPDSELEAVRAVVSSTARYTVHPLLKEGSWVRIKCGPLRELEGRLVRFKAGPRLVISVALLAKSVAVEVDLQDVEVRRQDGRRVA